jgi:drug/metabolite transporter (DMT)-like permease
MYEKRTQSILLCMIITGALRSVAVKLLYQIGLSAPFFVTLLYLGGQSLSLAVHCIGRRLGIVEKEHQRQTAHHYDSALDDEGDDEKKNRENDLPTYPPAKQSSAMPSPNRQRSGSLTGITEESSEASAVSCIHAIPPPLRPAVPGMFNLINSAMRWASLVYVPASTAEMLISGLELILSTVAARVIRKRMISMQRWGGVCIVAMGLVVVRLSEISPASDDADANGDLMFSNVTVNDDDNVAEGAGVDNENAASASATTSSIQTTERLIGDILIVGQCIMSVLQDLAEELFMHEAELSPTLLLGWEGVFGLAFGLPLYLPLAPFLGEDPNEVWELLKSSTWVLAYVSGLVLLFTATGVFNIVATAVMSSMTRNIWKNFRSLAVWILGLCLYYSSGNESSIGERWKIPASFVTLLGFATMLGGICLYYRTPEARTLDSGCQWGRKRYSAVNIVVDDEEAPNGCDSSIELVQPTTMLHAGTN